ncbi:MAG TPA: acyl-CoA dehydrogenase family protein [Amycolatopsis sp.]|nr:acyl-CoA dehydrogenase family protein [Amycolatopsis sp.]
MNYEFTAEQQAFRASVRKVFEHGASAARLRQLWDTETGRAADLWDDLSTLGAPAILVPEEYGGLGGTELDLCPLLEESGWACVPDALVEGLLAGPALLAEAATEEQKAKWLPGVARGSSRLTFALPGTRYVPDAHVSDLIILGGRDEVRVYERDEVALAPVRSMDPARRLFTVTPRPGSGARLPGGRAALSRAESRIHAGSGAVLTGLAERMLRMSVDHVKVRHQFGRPVGSFQAVKHLLAQATSLVTLATRSVRSASCLLAQRAPHAQDAALLARICAVEAEFEANRVSLQTHGGIGFTFEHDLHLWLKRGKAMETAYGGHREPARRAGLLPMSGRHGVLTTQILGRSSPIRPQSRLSGLCGNGYMLLGVCLLLVGLVTGEAPA